jgi:hypothetical protein
VYKALFHKRLQGNLCFNLQLNKHFKPL